MGTEWAEIVLALTQRPGVAMFLGASDTGKTTLLRAAAVHLTLHGRVPLAVVDADIGQSTVGPPTTVGLSLLTEKPSFSDLRVSIPCHALSFVGSVTPVGHLLQTLVATKRLTDKAMTCGAASVLVDTTGLIGQGVGLQLKLRKVELLAPRHLIALQRENELESLLSVLSGRPGMEIHQLAVSPLARTRSQAERYQYRVERFKAYFGEAERLTLPCSRVVVLPPPTGLRGLARDATPPLVSVERLSSASIAGVLVGLNDSANETVGLGLLEGVSPDGLALYALTPLRGAASIRIVQLGSLRLRRTGEELMDEG